MSERTHKRKEFTFYKVILVSQSKDVHLSNVKSFLQKDEEIASH